MTSPFENFEDLILHSKSEMIRELRELMISTRLGIDWYKVLMVGKKWQVLIHDRGECVVV